VNIRIARTDAEFGACIPVLRELRPHITEDELVERIRRQVQSGYRIALLSSGDDVVAVAGFRIGENLAWDRFLYIDDLVTRASDRSRGHGARLLTWLREYASREGCAQLHLDSGMQRKEAHRFYEREGMEAFGLHFAERLAVEDPPVTNESPTG
jgi:GNAT superfamily N-acetyltransferase